MWPLLLDFAAKKRVQLFFSTHSKEWIDSAESVLANHAEDFSFLRTVREFDPRVGLAECKVYQYRAREARSAIEHGVDLRGQESRES